MSAVFEPSLTDMERHVNDLMKFENHRRYVKQSETGELPERKPASFPYDPNPPSEDEVAEAAAFHFETHA